MACRFDHITLVVRDLERAKGFFGALGFEETTRAVISGEEFARYMGVPGLEADHVTLELKGGEPRTQVQFLHYRHPPPALDPAVRNLARLGFNHVCFAVDDLAAAVGRLRAAGFATRGPALEYHDRQLVFLDGPEGVTIELAQWQA